MFTLKSNINDPNLLRCTEENKERKKKMSVSSNNMLMISLP